MDLMDLTPGELGHAQRKAKLEDGILGVLESPSHKGWVDAVGALAWVVMRRDDQALTLEDVMGRPLNELVEVLGLDVEGIEGEDEGRP